MWIDGASDGFDSSGRRGGSGAVVKHSHAKTAFEAKTSQKAVKPKPQKYGLFCLHRVVFDGIFWNVTVGRSEIQL